MNYYVLFISAVSSVSWAQEQKNIDGYVTFWSRECAPECPLPQPMGPSIPVEGILDAPVSPMTITRFEKTYSQGDYKAVFSMSWVYNSTASRYFVTTVSINRISTGTPLAQCSSYTSEMDSIPFPAGACSGFIASDKKNLQIGFSFSRVPLQQ